MLLRKSLVSLFSLIIFIVSLASCEEEVSFSNEQRLEAEKQMYLQFLEENFDSLYNISKDTVVGSKTSFDLVFWGIDSGYPNDPNKNNNPNITTGDFVSLRFTQYYLDVDTATNKVVKSKQGSNVDGALPYEFTVGADKTIPGLNSGLKFMRKGSKAVMLMPSTLTDGSYTSSYFEVDVVSVIH